VRQTSVAIGAAIGAADRGSQAQKAPPPSDDLFAEDAGITDEIAKPVPFDYDGLATPLAAHTRAGRDWARPSAHLGKRP
jgi:hypothetical protein